MRKQITEQEIDLIVARLNKRVQEANEVFLKQMGKQLDEMQKLKPSDAYRFAQTLKYGGKYEEIVKTMNKYTELNLKDIDAIFEEYAKRDSYFYEQFYKYRDIPFTPYEENEAIKTQTETLSELMRNKLYVYTRSNVIGYNIHEVTANGKLGKLRFNGLRETYNKLIDTATMNVGQGKETFDQAVMRILVDIGMSGLRTISYESGRSMRLDSAIMLHLGDMLGNLFQISQLQYGREFGADAVEITVHFWPAPDHMYVQGHRFTLNQYDEEGNLIKEGEFEKFQNDQDCVDVNGVEYPATSEETGYDRRSIGQYHCRHKAYPIILGASRPIYSDEELKEILNRMESGFEFEGKQYTTYEGSQLQRKLERKIREQKDIQIFALYSNNKELVSRSQSNITKLTAKYRDLNKASGLPAMNQRLRVPGYKRVKVN